jgi:hypothetical protein
MHEGFVNITPAPVLTGLEGLYEGMVGAVEVLGGVLVLGGVAATNVPTNEADPQMHPGVSTCQAFLTAMRAGCDSL